MGAGLMLLVGLPLMLLAGTLLDIATNDDSGEPSDDLRDVVVTDVPVDQEPIL